VQSERHSKAKRHDLYKSSKWHIQKCSVWRLVWPNNATLIFNFETTNLRLLTHHFGICVELRNGMMASSLKI
jgi:hypothetical protein